MVGIKKSLRFVIVITAVLRVVFRSELRNHKVLKKCDHYVITLSHCYYVCLFDVVYPLRRKRWLFEQNYAQNVKRQGKMVSSNFIMQEYV